MLDFLSQLLPQNQWQSARLQAGLLGAGTDILQRILTNAANRKAWEDYWNRGMQTIAMAAQQAPGLNTAQMINAAGNVGADVARSYERALSKVTPTADARLAATQMRGLARSALSQPGALLSSTLQSIQSGLEGLRRDASQMARNTGSASAYRDIVGQVGQRGISPFAQALATASQAANAAHEVAGRYFSAAPQILDQSQAMQYNLWARPREAQLSGTASQLAARDTVYDQPTQHYALINLLRAYAGNKGGWGMLGLPPNLANQPGTTDSKVKEFFLNYIE